MVTTQTGGRVPTQATNLVAPYHRFRKTHFYDTTFINGTYSADIIGCPWTCDGCWSGYGYTGSEPKYHLEPDEVVEKLLAGMVRNKQQAARITGGEPTMRWAHMMGVVDSWMESVVGARMVIEGETTEEGEPMVLVIETNGSLGALDRIDDVQDRYGKDAKHLLLHFGLKASDPEQLEKLTGIKSAEAAHRRQVTNLLHVARETEIDLHISVFDAYSTPAGVEDLEEALEDARPGLSRDFTVQKYVRSYGKANRFRTPKRHRTSGDE